MHSTPFPTGPSQERVQFAARPSMNAPDGDLKRFARAAILASFAMAAIGVGITVLPSSNDPGERPRSVQAQAATESVNNPEELLAAIGRRRELATLPILADDPSLKTSSQQWADGLAARGVGHDPAILDGITDNWQQVSELVSAGPTFAAASNALLAKAAGTSPLDDAKVTSVGIGNHVEGSTTFVVVRLLRLPPTSDVNVQMGF